MTGVIYSRLLATAAFLTGFVLFPGRAIPAQLVDPASLPVLTNIIQIWQIPVEQRPQPRRIQTELLIYTHDREWNNSWGECHGVPNFLPIADCPLTLKPGQRVAVDGVILPEREQLLWDRTQIQVIGEAELKPRIIPDLSDPRSVALQLVSVVCLVDTKLADDTHLTLRVLSGNSVAMLYAVKGTNAIRAEPGDFVRLQCVNSPSFDRDGNLASLTLYVANTDSIEIVGNLGNDPRFDGTVRLSRDIKPDSPTHEMFVVEGVVRSHEPGKWLTLWDETGQIAVRSDQTLPVHVGQRVRAFGYPFVVGVQQCLRGGVYRPVPTQADVPLVLNPDLLHLAEQVRDLSPAEARRGPKVRLRGVVTWAHDDTPFAYVTDGSGGLKVLNPKWVGADSWKPGTIVNVEGTVAEGEFVPVITNAVLTRAGWAGMENAPFVPLEQALTGVEDGHWIEMRGFVRQVLHTNGLVRLDLSTSSGEFTTWTPTSPSLFEMQGSIIRVVGVCSATANERHQLTGIQIWSPETKYFKVEEPKPRDLFALPLRPLASLRQFSIERGLNRRIRTVGTVVLQAPGRFLCIQDGSDGLFALSLETNRFEIGDRVEVVGFAGNEGRKFLLRETVFRRIGRGVEPPPTQLTSLNSVNLALEGRLARVEGTLFNIVTKHSDVALLIHSEDAAFEARLDAALQDPSALKDLEIGSRISVTGLYAIQSDEHGAPRAFMLQLRRPGDVQVLQRPPWWTFARLLGALFAVLAISGLGLAWALFIAHKNKLLHQAQTALQKANDELEHRVEKRTRELKDQVEAKERARTELALTQQRLIAASRQAGMAEVATGVLHNVGNVLNSVNVSASLVAERLRSSRVDLVSKCAGLLKRPPDQLARFLTEDAKGKSLPGYLEQLGTALENEHKFVRSELESLAKNIDHIKVIVAMQQSHAKSAGVLEELDPKELIEDAINVNSAALERHGIEIRRQYENAPRLISDRHKVLQILINLISNAKWALSSRSSNREITVSLAAVGENGVSISVRDNGQGISSENLQRIFAQGFTTRKDGHGFGLHSGANAARELGGSLTAFSDGPGTGAMFVLELPLTNETKRVASANDDLFSSSRAS